MVQFLGAVFVGKQVGTKLSSYIMRQIGILITDKPDNEKMSMLETHMKWVLMDLNMLYEKQLDKFRDYLGKKGYIDLTVNVHPEKKEEEEKK